MGARAFMCGILLAIPAHAAPLLSIDFNHRTNDPAISTMPGFTSFIINSNVSPRTAQTNPTIRVIGQYHVSLWATGLSLAYTDRSNAEPTNQGAFTESLLLRDGVYSPATTTNGGLNVLITNLPASNRLQVTVWSYDWVVDPPRVSDWYANGVLVKEAYRFTNSVLPESNEQYRFSFPAMVDSAGRLLIEGRWNALSLHQVGLQPSVYLNALQIDREPLKIVRIEPSGSELRLTFVVWPQPGSYLVQEFAGGQWLTVSSAIYAPAVNNRVTARFPRPNGVRFYRVRYQY